MAWHQKSRSPQNQATSFSMKQEDRIKWWKGLIIIYKDHWKILRGLKKICLLNVYSCWICFGAFSRSPLETSMCKAQDAWHLVLECILNILVSLRAFRPLHCVGGLDQSGVNLFLQLWYLVWVKYSLNHTQIGLLEDSKSSIPSFQLC